MKAGESDTDNLGRPKNKIIKTRTMKKIKITESKRGYLNKG